MSAFYDNFLSHCNRIGKSPSKVILEIGLQKSSVTRWKAGGNPTDATAQKVANYFNISVSELFDEELNKKKPTSLSESGPAYPPKYDLLTPENREIVDRLIAGLVENQSPD